MNDTSYVDLNDKSVSDAPFNTSNSKLWQQLINTYDDTDIKNNWNSLTNSSILSVGTFEKYYNQNIISIMGERMYN
jgi:hypothetical protein